MKHVFVQIYLPWKYKYSAAFLWVIQLSLKLIHQKDIKMTLYYLLRPKIAYKISKILQFLYHKLWLFNYFYLMNSIYSIKKSITTFYYFIFSRILFSNFFETWNLGLGAIRKHYWSDKNKNLSNKILFLFVTDAVTRVKKCAKPTANADGHSPTTQKTSPNAKTKNTARKSKTLSRKVARSTVHWLSIVSVAVFT